MERTFVMVKPDGIKKGLVGEVIKRIEDKGLAIKDIRKTRMTPSQFKRLYAHIYKKYPKIVKSLFDVITKKDVVVMIVEGSNAAKKVQKIRGPSNPAEAPRGTIRGDFARDQDMRKLYKKGRAVMNIMHSSDDKKQAGFEIKIFFKE